MINRDLLRDWQNRWTKCEGRKDGERWTEKQTRGCGRTPVYAWRLPRFEVPMAADWLGAWDASVCERFAWHRQRGGKAVCISRCSLPTQTSAWTGAKVPARRSAKTLLSVLALHFFLLLHLPFSFLPLRPCLTLFCSLSFSPRASPVCCSSSFSHLTPSATASRSGHLFDTSPPLPLVRRVWCLIFLPPPLKRLGGLAFFQVFFSSI